MTYSHHILAISSWPLLKPVWWNLVTLDPLCDGTNNFDRDRDQGRDQKYDGTGTGTKDWDQVLSGTGTGTGTGTGSGTGTRTKNMTRTCNKIKTYERFTDFFLFVTAMIQ